MHFTRFYLRIYLLIFLSFFNLKNSYALDSLSYSGRLVQANGAPVAGPVNLRAELVYTNNTSTVLCSDDISGVALSKGVFHVKLDFACTGGKTLTQVLSLTPANESVAIQIIDVSNSKAYSFQAIHAMPFANVASIATQLEQNGAADGEFLKWNNTNKKWEPGSVSGASGGTVTNVSVSAPLNITNPTTTPSITIAQATTSTSGYLTSADWNTFNSKEGTIAGGTATQFYRGDKTWQTLDTSAVPENVNLYFTNARVLGVPLTGFVTAAGAIVATDTTLAAFEKAQGQINAINTASANYLIKNSTDSVTGVVNVGTTGLLQLAYVPVGMNDAVNKSYADTKLNLTGGTLSGVLTVDDDLRLKGGSNHVTVKGHATSANYNLTLPQTAGTAGYVLSTDGSGNTSWASPSVGSATITDGSIVDADINASAAIAQTKIANLTTDLSSKQPLISAGTTLQYYRGDKTFVDLGTDVRATALTGFATGANSTVLATDTTLAAFQKVQGQIDATNTAVAGKEPVLANPSDTTKFYRGDKSWQTLNSSAVANTSAGNIAATNVQSALNELDSEKQNLLTATSIASVGEIRFYELSGNGTDYVSLKAPNALAANLNYIFPSVAPSAGQVLSSDASGNMSWLTIPSAPVTSVFGRSGVVVQVAGDYNASQITNTPAGSIAATTVQAALNELDSEKEPALTNPSDTTKYYRGDKTWSTFATDAINSVLSTFAVGTGTKPAVTNSDTVVGAFGKVQKTLNDINSDYVSKSANNTVTGSFNISGITSFIQVPTPSGAVVNEAANVQYVQNALGSLGQWSKGTGGNVGDIYFNSGKVGIGTANPTYALEVKPVVNSSVVMRLTGMYGATNNDVQLRFAGQKDGELWAIGSDIQNASGSKAFEIYDLKNNVTRMAIDSTGNVGIGVLSASMPLHVASGSSSGGAGLQTAVQIGAVGTGAGPLYLTHNNPTISGNSYFNGSWLYGGGTAKPGRIDFANGVHVSTSNNAVGAAGASLSDLTVKLSVLPDGSVTTPAQPAFEAKLCSTVVNPGSPMIWESVLSNVGNGYNPANGVFTAPIAGTYVFGFNTLMNFAATGEFRYEFFKNGALYNGVIRTKAASGWETIQGTDQIYLNAGETIYINYSTGTGPTYIDCHYNRFWGRLSG
jgi:hypothetical protein